VSDDNSQPRKEVIITFFNNQEKPQNWDVHICKRDNSCVWCHKEILKGAECFRVMDGLIHIDCAKFRESLRPAWWLAERLSISSAQFLHIVRKNGILYDNFYFTHFKTTVYLWNPNLVEQLKDTPDVVKAREKRRKVKE
jgi:hypothetical protein